MRTFAGRFGTCAGMALCLLSFFWGDVRQLNADDRQKVIFLVSSDSGDKYEIVFPVPALLSCKGYLEDLEKGQTFKNAYNFSFAQPGSGDVFINIICLQGVAKESVIQMMAAPKKQEFEDYKTSTEVKRKRFFGYSYIFQYATDEKRCLASASIYLDDKFFIVTSMDNITHADAERLLDAIFAGFDASEVQKR